MGIGNVLSLLTNPISLTAILLVIALGWIGQSDFEEEVRQQVHYCDMVSKHRASGGEVGWPDHQGRYEEDCL